MIDEMGDMRGDRNIFLRVFYFYYFGFWLAAAAIRGRHLFRSCRAFNCAAAIRGN